MKRLGRGLADIIDIPTIPSASTPGFMLVRAEKIHPGRFQPRSAINEASLAELKASIQQSGIIEPILVRPSKDGYELIAGERRFRAAQALGIQDIPVIVKTLTDQQALELSLVENVQRVDLNPVEEARGYARLIEEFGYTQERVAETIGKDRATIANLVRILKLPETIRQGLLEGKISLGHAKVLASLEDPHRQVALYQASTTRGLSVRQLEGLAASSAPGRKRRLRRLDPELSSLEDTLRRALGTKVIVKARAKGGRIVIEYFSAEDLSRIAQLLKVVV